VKFNDIEINVLDQKSIDAAKAQMPGMGVALAVASELIRRIAEGQIVSIEQIPGEYAPLGELARLPAKIPLNMSTLEITNTNLAKDFIAYKEKHFFVSTINRRSSAALAYGGLYAETMAWEWNPATNTRGSCVGQDASGEDSLMAHKRVCENLRTHGVVELPEED